MYDYQYRNNAIYRQFINIVRYNGFKPGNVSEIPFLPITLFQSNMIQSGSWHPECVFLSSGTTGSRRSKNPVRQLSWYLDNASFIWEQTFGPLAQTEFVSVLPNYHQNTSSSLIHMVQHFMLNGARKQEAFYHDEYQRLHDYLEHRLKDGDKVVLFGVSFALLDYVKLFSHSKADSLLVIETGGMKKFRKEVTRSFLHATLKDGFQGAQVISEYGMTECFSQLYSAEGGLFESNPRMSFIITEPEDQKTRLPQGRRGRINLIDLANIDTISFISTDDYGMIHGDGCLEIMGRIDSSDLRGCNYLV